ncbi:hypothetical protein [Pseudomonas fluorescens]|uniref:hypothetical protein n=1 Tax=Pseudomonas fluorescens TaxID=294 RepID=UPI000F82C1E6|nr:hypothetical protein [Pseudomonas fluorescens]
MRRNPVRKTNVARSFDRFGVAVGQRLYASRLVDIEHATLEGRVALLLVEADGSEAGAQVAEEDAALDELILAVIRQAAKWWSCLPSVRCPPTPARRLYCVTDAQGFFTQREREHGKKRKSDGDSGVAPVA